MIIHEYQINCKISSLFFVERPQRCQFFGKQWLWLWINPNHQCQTFITNVQLESKNMRYEHCWITHWTWYATSDRLKYGVVSPGADTADSI